MRDRGGASFKCPNCEGTTRVRTTWPTEGGIIRDRQCVDCNRRIVTKELFADHREDVVLVKDKKSPAVEMRKRTSA
jgi:transcriptional regulator NrdR family protein